MTERFSRRRDQIVVELPGEERALLGQILDLLAEVEESPDDPGYRRLNIPAYLDDPGANAEWSTMMGDELARSRAHDRAVYQRVTDSNQTTFLDSDDANAFLRVLNEGRLAFAARLGLEVAADHDAIPDMERAALDYLGWILEDLTMVLMADL